MASAFDFIGWTPSGEISLQKLNPGGTESALAESYNEAIVLESLENLNTWVSCSPVVLEDISMSSTWKMEKGRSSRTSST